MLIPEFAPLRDFVPRKSGWTSARKLADSRAGHQPHPKCASRARPVPRRPSRRRRGYWHLMKRAIFRRAAPMGRDAAPKAVVLCAAIDSLSARVFTFARGPRTRPYERRDPWLADAADLPSGKSIGPPVHCGGLRASPQVSGAGIVFFGGF